MKKPLLILLAIIVLAVILFFTLGKKDKNNTDVEMGAITGTLTYLDRMALPSDSIITVSLQDISLADAPAVKIAETTFTTEGNQVPLNFNISYDKSKITENHTYSVSAKVYSNDELIRATTDNYSVITNGAPTEDLELILNIVSREVDNASSTNSTSTSEDNTSKKVATNIELDGKNFVLLSVNGKNILTTSSSYSLSFSGNRISGKFCNNVSGEYTLVNDVLTAPRMISTMMYCESPEGLMDAENTFSKILGEGAKVNFSGKTLTIESGSDKMVFESK